MSSTFTSQQTSAPVLVDHEPTRSMPMRVIRRPPMRKNELIALHRHPWPQITFALEGVIRVATPGKSWVVPPLRAIWIPAMVNHAVTTLSPAVMHAVRVREQLKGKWKKPQVIEVSSLLRESIIALRAIEDEPRRKRWQALCDLILDEVIHSPTLPLSIPMPKDKRLLKLCTQLISEPRCNLTLDEWARRVGASVRTLERTFESELSVSFRQWRQAVRLSHSIALIGQGQSIARASEATGYQSPSAFAAAFRKAFGSSPRNFFQSE